MLKMRVEWVEKTSGPQHAPLWTSSAYIQGSLYGSGHGNTRVAAREAAARQACMNLSESHQ
ncbi:hypothetical protein OBBRIDRAFT_790498 [Obba rivulosa]|uniref:DRBM domain-containing protein n=1 Tax=Obba rivulosa TaxID=1052685 RepID=A0A8E2DN55_9APHY|nr:hypothetical protein OBBRIDRAFT_790498 [Obba rivulosa]